MTKLRTFCAALFLALLLAPQATAGPNPATNWFSLINTTHANPTGMTVIVVPPAYFSYQAMGNLAWVGPNALYDDPGTQAILEAIEYWEWMLAQFTGTHPQLSYVTWTTKVLGVDATPADLASADIVVNTAMVTDPIPLFLYHLGLGLPTTPASAAVFSGGYMDRCTVWNTGLGRQAGNVEPARLRNLVVHEFGHCISAGHTGTSLGLSHCDSAGTCYTSHTTDVMSQVNGAGRQCLSNLNVQSVAEGYAWKTSATSNWAAHDGETYMLKTAYATTCMPASMNRF